MKCLKYSLINCSAVDIYNFVHFHCSESGRTALTDVHESAVDELHSSVCALCALYENGCHVTFAQKISIEWKTKCRNWSRSGCHSAYWPLLWRMFDGSTAISIEVSEPTRSRTHGWAAIVGKAPKMGAFCGLYSVLRSTTSTNLLLIYHVYPSPSVIVSVCQCDRCALCATSVSRAGDCISFCTYTTAPHWQWTACLCMRAHCRIPLKFYSIDRRWAKNIDSVRQLIWQRHGIVFNTVRNWIFI